ncbi:hypothetical protein [Yoonia sp.]|jgi:hypothetical protein|uniref:hypothetical protein n=1 Tax=Yoonia sp. TaxID=2212373 RepID=UPI0025E56AAA|nr:hypothetical protein [Yoonia sp.]
MLDIDLIFVLGLIAGAFSIPALVSAFADRRAPKMSVLIMLISAGMIGYAVQQRPEPYELDKLDEVFVSVVGRYLN